MPMCARCLGVGIGQLIGFALFVAGVRVSLVACVAGALVMLLDWGAQEYFGRTSTNPRRLVTGLLAGCGLGTLYCQALVFAWRFVM